MDTAANILALVVCAVVGGGILGVGMSFGIRISGESGWPIAPLAFIAVISGAVVTAHLLKN